MPQEVASLFGTLDLQDNMTPGLQNARNSLRGLASNLTSTGRDITGLGAQMTAFTAPLALGMGAGVAAAASFEDSLTEVGARAQLTAEDLQLVGDYALEMGANTAFSAQQALDAFLQLLTSGQTVEEAMATLPHVLNAAAASGADLGRVADDVTNIMASFRLGVEDAEMVVNALATASGASSASMESLAEGFANVGPVAAEFGLSVEETAAALAVLADNGIQGAEAGTSLKSMLLAMAAEAREAGGAFDELGVAFYDAAGEMRPFEEILDDLDLAMSELPAEETNRLMVELAGAYGITGLSALLAADGIDSMMTSMDESASAADVAGARMGTLNGLIDSLRGSFETLMITALTPFIDDHLKPMVENMIPVINSITAWTNANPELTAQIIQLVGILTIAGPLLAGLGLVISGVGTAIAFIASPVGIAVGAIAALGAAFATNFGGIRDIFEQNVQPALDTFFDTLETAWTTVQPALENMRAWFVDDVLPAISDVITNNVLPAWNSLTAGLMEIWTVVGPHLEALSTWFLSDGLAAIQTFISETVIPAVGGLVDILRTIWETVQPGLLSLADWFLNTGLPGVVSFVEGTVVPMVETFVTILSTIWDLVSPAVTALGDGISGVMTSITGAIQSVIDLVGQLLDRLAELGGAWGGISDNASVIGDGLSSGQFGLADVLNAAAGAIGAELGFRAEGGPVSAGSPYIVGERGPELFIPSQSGSIVPNGAAMGGQQVVVNLTMYGESPYEVAEMVQRALREMSG